MGVKEELRFIFQPNVIYEGILTMLSDTGEPHIASMGFSFNEDYDLIIRPFKDTLSYRYVSVTKKAVVNVTNDVDLFFKATYGNPSKDMFSRSYKLRVPRLKEAKLYIEGSLKAVEEDEVRAKFILEPVWLYSKRTYERPLTRADYAVLEALIHSTRIEVFMKMKLYNEVERLVSLIDYYDKLVARIAPKTKYQRLMEEINKIVESKLKSDNK